MLSESDVLAAIPDEGFVREYVRYAMNVTDANAAYHVAGALVLLSQVVPANVYVPWAGRLHANFYALCVGPSTDSRKSAGVSICRDILEDAGLHEQIGDEPGSREGLVDMLAAQPHSVVFYPEFGDFLASTKSGYLEQLRPAYTAVYDCKRISRALARRKGSSADAPRLSLFGGVTIAHLEAYTFSTDWGGGFMGRFFTVYAPRERDYAIPMPPDEAAHADVTDRLRKLASRDPSDPDLWAGQCVGLDDAAQRRYRDWYADTMSQHKNFEEEARAGLHRGHAMAVKIALLLSYDAGIVTHDPWRIGEEEVFFATKIVDLHLRSVREIASRLAPTRDLRDRRKVLQVVRDASGPISLGEISRRSKVGLKKRVIEVVQTLEEEKMIRRLATPNGAVGDFFVAVEHDASPDAKVIQLFKDAMEAPDLEVSTGAPTPANRGGPSTEPIPDLE